MTTALLATPSTASALYGGSVRTMVTSSEAARLVGISPSTFRAYVARNQAPRPDSKIGGTNVWSLATLRNWRELRLSQDEQLLIRAEIAKKMTLQHWEESTRRDLAQLRLNHRQAQSLIDRITPEGVDLQTYIDARWVLDVRRELRQRIINSWDTAEPVHDEHELLRSAAERVAAGDDVFQVRAQLTMGLVSGGLAEPLAPKRYDLAFWVSQDSADSFTDYLKSMDRVPLPEVI